MQASRALLVAAVVANGLLAGAALDQAVKQLPARHSIGVEAFSAYSQAGDLANGVAWYASLAICAVILTAAAVTVGLRTTHTRTTHRLLWAAAAATVGHMITTAFAAPLNFSQRQATNAHELTEIFDTFAQLNALRAVLQVTALASLALALLQAVRRPEYPG